MPAIKVEMKGNKAYIKSPYNANFVSRIKLMGGKWNMDSRRWEIKADALGAAREIMMDIYGETDQEPAAETVTLVIEFSKDVIGRCEPISIAGKTIARAFGRDSGAKIGDDAAFISGEPRSDGSARNWTTVIPAGCVVEVYNVPKSKADEFVSASDPRYTIHIKGDVKVDREALMKEREALLARLAEINKILGE